MERRNWTRQELIVAFNLYCKTPFGRIHNRNPEIIALAAALGRTPSALSWKLANFARFDPALKKRNIAGAGHGAKLERDVWDEFSQDWERLSFESERLRSQLLNESAELDQDVVFPDGKTRDVLVKLRVNQGFFRSAVLAAYGSKCCITGIAVTDLLCASHIVPWSVDHKNRTNPRNGLCLNALHDRAFDRGLLTIGPDYKVRLSRLIRCSDDRGIEALLRPYDGTRISLPERFQPDLAFLQYHADNVYRDA
jgi:putative restriction endonuclease